MSHLPTPTLQAKQKEPIQKTADVALAAKDLKETIRKIDGIVAGQVSSEEEEHWKSRIVYTGEVLGVGGFSVVHGAKDTMTGLEYAVKVVNIPPDNACFVRRLIREVGLLKELDHPNIVKLHKCLETSDRCQLFMERCQGGELLGLMEHIEFSHDGVRWLRFEHVNGGEPVEFTEVDIIYILHQVLEAVKFCHERNIVHRDLKMENLLLVYFFVVFLIVCICIDLYVIIRVITSMILYHIIHKDTECNGLMMRFQAARSELGSSLRAASIMSSELPRSV